MKKVLSLILYAVFAISLSISTLVEDSTAATIELKFTHSFSPKHVLQTGVFEPWGKKLAEQTNGQVKVTMFPGGALGKPGDLYKLAEKGIADIVYLLHDYSPGRFPMTSVFELPFMTPTSTIAGEAMWKTFEKYPDFQKEYSNYKVLGLYCHAAGHFHTTKKAIRSTDDFKGMKIRTASPSVTEALKIFGAIPVEMPVTETYTALERGVVDGTVVPFEGLVTFKFHELVKYSTLTDFYTVTMATLMNKAKYDSLPEDVKKVIDDNSGFVMSSWCGKRFDETEAPMKQEALASGLEAITLPEAELQKLHDLTIPLRESWIKSMADRGLDGKAVLEGALGFLGLK
jgi:TRAP-type C4-dicarboxylate transport system substrate-binding protein